MYFDLTRWILKTLVLLSFDLISVLFNLSFCTTQFEIRNLVKIELIFMTQFPVDLTSHLHTHYIANDLCACE
jgi:hypothetical protein